MTTSAAVRSISSAAAAQKRHRFQVVVVGAGQAGLAVASQLVAAGVDVIVLERESRIGESWRRRWDSLRLFTAAELVGLPGLPFPGDKNAFPSKDDIGVSRRSAERTPVRVNTMDSLDSRLATNDSKRTTWL